MMLQNVRECAAYDVVSTSKEGTRTVRVAKTIDEAKELLEVGFEYVADMDNLKLFRKRK